ncbi:MAG TPA: thioesterase family protein [Solirubrobacteraceae bacterium]|nr:thioesterase family protein [Solirubrobacteraceae bacterium]
MADDAAQGAAPAGADQSAGKFESDTAVRRMSVEDSVATFSAEVSPDWRAGRGPHGGYLAAMLTRALMEHVADPQRAPRSLTVHYARAPEPGPAQIVTRIERVGRSLTTLSARMEQDGRPIALVLSAFSVPWAGPEFSELEMPAVRPPDPERRPGPLEHGGPPFTEHLVMQHRIGELPTKGSVPMLIGAWVGLAEQRPVDPPLLAFLSDALIPAPFLHTRQFAPAPTVDLTVHFRAATPRGEAQARSEDPAEELCLVQMRTKVIQEGFFEEDGTIWASDGTLLAQSRQLAILMPSPSS